MKKLIFLFAMVFSTGYLMAQNTSTVTQDGFSNLATVDQYGKNLTQIEQIGSGNKAIVDQGTALQSQSNYRVPAYSTDHEWGAWVKQDGVSNSASINQQGSSGSADINQDGSLNVAVQDIHTFASGATANTRKGLDIDQIGNRNESIQLTRASFGSYGIKKMYVDQIGNDNYANQYSNGGMASTMTIKQEGSNNGNAVSSDVAATGLSSPLSLAWGTLMHPANSGGIDAVKISHGGYTQYQNGRYSTATIDITGDGNKTTQAQEFTVWSVSGQNSATLFISGNDNAVIQAQMGEYNSSDVDVTGNGNVISTSQLGDSNSIDIDVLGSFNIAGIQQAGDSHSATVLQMGSNNFAQITQD